MDYRVTKAELEVFEEQMSELVREGYIPIGTPIMTREAPITLLQGSYKPRKG